MPEPRGPESPDIRLRNLAWEMVGYGESIPEGRERDISVARQADYLLAWLMTLGIDRAVLAGHDLGGGVVQIAAVRQPAVCAGLFLTNAIGYDSWPIPSVKALRAMGALVERLCRTPRSSRSSPRSSGAATTPGSGPPRPST